MCASNIIATVWTLFSSNMTMSLCIRQGSKRKWLIESVWKNLTGLHKTKSWSQFNTSGVTVNADLEPKTHHQTPMTCTYGFSHFRHLQNCCNRDENTIFKYMNYVPIVVATDLEVHFSVLKKGMSQYFCLYSVCTSHWCLVMSFWLKVCIYRHTRGVVQVCTSVVQFLSRHFSVYNFLYFWALSTLDDSKAQRVFFKDTKIVCVAHSSQELLPF